MIVRAGGVSRRVATTRRRVRGYSASKQAYDSRRRSDPLDAVGLFFKRIVQADPCPFCEVRFCDADHIVPLGAGGENEWTNLSGLCNRHNRSKKNKPLLQWMLELVA